MIPGLSADRLIAFRVHFRKIGRFFFVTGCRCAVCTCRTEGRNFDFMRRMSIAVDCLVSVRVATPAVLSESGSRTKSLLAFLITARVRLTDEDSVRALYDVAMSSLRYPISSFSSNFGSSLLTFASPLASGMSDKTGAVQNDIGPYSRDAVKINTKPHRTMGHNDSVL